MFNRSEEELAQLGADITTREIKQQPRLWEKVIDQFEQNQDQYASFIADLKEEYGRLRVIFTGAGTSAFVGDSIKDYLNAVNKNEEICFEAIATTDIVAAPNLYLEADVPTVLVSFARSGNSPESVATVELAEKIVNNLKHVTITCAKDGKLAQAAEGSSDNLLILQPELSNDQGFAMTGSFTCMALSALLLFDPNASADKIAWAKGLVKAGDSVIEREDEIQDIVDTDFDRIVYLGTGYYFGLAKESQLKILELTAGKIATQYESPLGFRHGPKSFVNDKTMVILFASSDPYSVQYDQDIMNEVYYDKVAARTLSISSQKLDHDAQQFIVNADGSIPDAYLVLPYVMIAQTISLMSSVKVGNKPDQPSPSGTVNRVVKGVTIYDYEA